MDTLSSIINKKVKPQLVRELGIALATLVILQCGKQCNVFVANIDIEGYGKLINAISADKRVTHVFDKKKLRAMKTSWLKEAAKL